MIKQGNVNIFEDHEQQLFRAIMKAKGEAKKPLIQQLIDEGLDEHAAILSWLKRVQCFDIYQQLKNHG